MVATRNFSIGPLVVVSSMAIIMSLPSTESFSPPSVRSSHHTSISESSPTCLRSIFDDDDKEEANGSSGGGVDFASFNPLKYQAAGSDIKNPNFNQISLRKLRMQEMTGELLDAVGNEAMTDEILNRFQDFLLQPLEDPDTILEPDSIYTPAMSRDERYEAYRTSMDERIQNSKSGSVRSVLQSMRDFVLNSAEEE